ncbi:PREDICTED: kinesin-like protein KIF20A [Miniopterus natalensis]|uniref:kinesin-like protein KIF20A n=1 Tax=Miniopterus natalensis TaxID=291302 RepID=UPI0007A729DB|nr:PREDICTED: kinesin-like protein KIF20A [Miniopterus natalensis]XP_016059254.1 PREDICTED: kinesin-like protein KIF20A [Miniopterus natalensis]XP_016059255.1 PREDICTED: kinesin-like protein KIF20A [Miniopterus natalensis]XP_016059256.1 PREDICTED: kinesin-like protein KIF20A [Miniopterus natalensis]
MSRGILSPPAGLLSDEEVVVSPMFESTAADLGSVVRKDLLSDCSVISTSLEDKQQVPSEDSTEKVKVYLRVRPLLPSELERQEDQDCIRIENVETLVLQAPKDSFAQKSNERGIGQAIHRFTFSQIFGPEVGQASFFNLTVKEMVKDVLKGQNWLIYTYGVTNSGKTHTIQGTIKDGGILPRSLALIFNSLQGQLHPTPDLKPLLSNEVIWLDSKQIRQEEMKKLALLNGGLQEEELSTSLKRSVYIENRIGTSTSFDSGIAGLSSTSQFTSSSQLDETSHRWAQPDTAPISVPADIRFSIWISFFEIYNELLYDLLEPPSHQRKRQILRLCEDQNGNPYVKDLNWIHVQDAEEALKLLKVGRKNQSFASTHLNQNSSRSHSIFSIRILHLQGEGDIIPKISELSLCDLAGSERCKDQKSGERLKEAGNINTSLHTLGRCIAALRQNQQNRSKQNLVPFRDSKLTRVFQGFFTGRGRSCMIVNVNPCASTYDETLHAAKFSAIASQLVHAPPVQLGFPSLHSFIKEHSLRTSSGLETGTKTDPGLDDAIENEADISMYGKEDLLQVVEAMKALLLKERQEKLQLEMQLRDEICNEMVEQMQQREQWCSEHLDIQKELLEETYEEKLKILKESLTNFYQEELQERDEKIKELEALLQEARQQPMTHQQSGSELSLRRSQRLAASSTQQLQEVKAKLDQCRAELNSTTEELQKYQKMLEPPPSAKPFTTDVDKKLEEGQKNIRLLRTELQKLGESLQSAERACCHSTGAGKLRQALTTCDDILIKQDQTLAELQNNMMLVKLDLRKKAACIAEQYHTVLKLQGQASSTKKRLGANQENQQPNQQPPGKKPFLRNLLPRTPTCQSSTDCSPYARILRSRRSPLLKSGPFGKKY